MIGLAFSKSFEASSAIILASEAYLLTTSASAETTEDFSSAIALSAVTCFKATASSSFLTTSYGDKIANLSLRTLISAFVSLSFFKPLDRRVLLIWSSSLLISSSLV
jgi:hypothetical protein